MYSDSLGSCTVNYMPIEHDKIIISYKQNASGSVRMFLSQLLILP